MNVAKLLVGITSLFKDPTLKSQVGSFTLSPVPDTDQWQINLVLSKNLKDKLLELVASLDVELVETPPKG